MRSSPDSASRTISPIIRPEQTPPSSLLKSAYHHSLHSPAYFTASEHITISSENHLFPHSPARFMILEDTSLSVPRTTSAPIRRLTSSCLEDVLLGRAGRVPRVSLGRASAPLGVDARSALFEGVGPFSSGLRHGLRCSPPLTAYILVFYRKPPQPTNARTRKPTHPTSHFTLHTSPSHITKKHRVTDPHRNPQPSTPRPIEASPTEQPSRQSNKNARNQ